MNVTDQMQQELQGLKERSNLRTLPALIHEGREVIAGGQRMLNLSSNDYLGLAADRNLREEFLQELTADSFLPTSSSSRLLTGNFTVYAELEQTLAQLFGTEAALVFNSGYHANTGILPAVSDTQTLILADKLVHASLIDGIRLSSAKCIRYRHNDLKQLERLLAENHAAYRQVIVVTESIFSMDGDTADLKELVRLKQMYENVLLYVDEAHAFGARGEQGLGCAEETGCIREIDFLVGTFGKAAASAGAYIVCRRTIREYLVNRMRTLIFTTALPPVNIAWTLFIVRRLGGFRERRIHLENISNILREALKEKGYECPSASYIVPMIVGKSSETIQKAEELQRHGFYALPVRPPTVPEGTSRTLEKRYRIMKQVYIIKDRHPRLLVFFAGWGADETPFKDYQPADSDYMLCYDYRTLEFDASLLKEYREINVIGWSMGVWAATQVMGKLQETDTALVIKNSIAINGTPYPIDDTYGIPTAIYHGTLEGLTGPSLHKFLRRMCFNGEAFKEFLNITPRRPLEELKEELAEIERMYLSLPATSFYWQQAVVGNNDRIIPPDNQLNAWRKEAEISRKTLRVHYTEDAHYQVELFRYYLQEIWTKD